MDRLFDDFVKAHEDELEPEMKAVWLEFRMRLLLANRLFKSMFPNSAAEGPGQPGEMQGTLMLAKLQAELAAVDHAVSETRKGE